MFHLSLRAAATGVAAALVCMAGAGALAQGADTASVSAGGLAQGADTPASSADASILPPITVTAQQLNEARAGIQTQTGASTYTIDAAAIAATPGGDNTAAQPSDPAGTGCGAGFVRPISRPRRTQRPAISLERHHPAGRHQRLRAVAGSAPHLLD